MYFSISYYMKTDLIGLYEALLTIAKAFMSFILFICVLLILPRFLHKLYLRYTGRYTGSISLIHLILNLDDDLDEDIDIEMSEIEAN